MEHATANADVKAQQRKHWNAVAEGWAAWADWTDRNFAPITDWFRQAGGWRPGARILDIACGPGYPALAAAKAVRPGGLVVATDISTAMVEAAAERAKSAGLDNLEFVATDAEALEFDDGSFDAVTTAYGLMFCPDPGRALEEAHRVLAPGGRVAIAVWDEISRSPFFAVITGAAAPFLGLPPPDPDAPGPFRLAPAGRLESLLEGSGFRDISVEACSMTFQFESVSEYCQIFSDVAWGARIAALSANDAARFRDAIAGAAQPFFDGSHLRLAAASRCASARKPQ